MDGNINVNRMKENLERLENQEMRKDIDLSTAQLSEDQRAFYDLNTVQTEDTQLKEILDHKTELKLSDERANKIHFTINRNENFRLINNKSFFGDSKYMTNVKDAVHNYEELINKELFTADELKYLKADGRAKFVRNRLDLALTRIDTLSEKCRLYLSRGKSIFFWKHDRYDAVLAAQERCTYERAKLQEMYDANDDELLTFAEGFTNKDTILTIMNKPALEARKNRRIELMKQINEPHKVEEKKEEAPKPEVEEKKKEIVQPVEEEKKLKIEKEMTEFEGKLNQMFAKNPEEKTKVKEETKEKIKKIDEKLEEKKEVKTEEKKEVKTEEKKEEKKEEKIEEKKEEKTEEKKEVEAKNEELKEYEEYAVDLDKYKGQLDAITEQRKQLIIKEIEKSKNNVTKSINNLKKNIERLSKIDKDKIKPFQKDILKKDEEKLYKLTHEKEVQQKADEDSKQFIKDNIEYDKAEKEVNEKTYAESMTKLLADLKELSAKKEKTADDRRELRIIQNRVAELVSNRAADNAVYARNALSMDIKKKIGFETLMDISSLLPMLKSDMSLEKVVSDYTSDKTKALDMMAERLMEYELDEKELLSDDALVLNMEKYNALAEGVLSFNRILEANPTYLDNKPELKAKLSVLTAASDYIRIKKQIFWSPANIEKNEITLQNYGKTKADFGEAHHRRLLMVSEVMRRNLLTSMGKDAGEDLLTKKLDNPYAEQDRQFALRLSREGKLRDQVERDKGVRAELLADMKAVKLRIAQMEESLASISDEENKKKKIVDMNGEIMHLNDLIRRYKIEEDEDPSIRIRDAIVTLEEERFHVPFDFNKVDLKNIPEKRKGDIDDILCLNVGTLNENYFGYGLNDLISKKMHYEKFTEWMKEYRKKYLIDGKLQDIDFKGSKSFINDFFFSDKMDRIIVHFKGSFHLRYTDAQMREQIMALSFSNSNNYVANKDDQETMAYQESQFCHMQMRLNSQVQSSTMRNIYGGVHKMLYMTPVDKAMSIDPCLRLEILAQGTTSNIDAAGNLGKYNEFIFNHNTTGRFMPLHEDIINISAGFAGISMQVGGIYGGNGFNSAEYLPAELAEKYDSFIKDYKEKHPKAKATEADLQFMLAHPEAWAQKDVYYSKGANKEADEKIKVRNYNLLTSQFKVKDIEKALNNKFITDATDKEIAEYVKAAKKQGFVNYDKYLKVMRNGFKGLKDIRELVAEVDEIEEAKKKLQSDVKALKKVNVNAELTKKAKKEVTIEAKKAHRKLMTDVSKNYADEKAKFRVDLSDEIKANVGDYDTMVCMSDFYVGMEKTLGKDKAMERFSALTKKYGSDDLNERYEAIDELAEDILKIKINSIDLSSDEAIAKNAGNLEPLFARVRSFKMIADKNPEYMKTLKDRDFRLSELLAPKLDILLAASDYYRIKKLLIEDETYSEMQGFEIGMVRKETDSFNLERIKKLNRAAYYLAENLSAKMDEKYVRVPLKVDKKDVLSQQDDKLLHALSTNPAYKKEFDAAKQAKIDKLMQEEKKIRPLYDEYKKKYDKLYKENGAQYEEGLRKLKEIEDWRKANKAKINDEKKQINDQLKALNNELKAIKDDTEKKEKQKAINDLKLKLDKVSRVDEMHKANHAIDEYKKKVLPVKEEADYWQEELRITTEQIAYEKNKTERDRIDAVINSLEAERFYLPTKWTKLSLDIVEKNTDPNFLEAIAAKTSEYTKTYYQNSGGTKIRNYITNFLTDTKEKVKQNSGESWSAKDIEFNELPHQYGKPCFDNMDRLMDQFAGAYAVGYSDGDMIEQFRTFVDLKIKDKKDAIMANPKLRAYYESAYKSMVKRLHKQLYSAVLRTANGLGDVGFALTPVDMIMQMNEMFRSELMAMSTIAQPFSPDNLKYLKQLVKEDYKNEFNVDYDKYLTLGNAYNSVVMAVQGYVDYYYKLSDIGSYTEEDKAMIKKEYDKYVKEHPKDASEKAYRAVADKLFDKLKLNTRKKLLSNGPDPEGNKERCDKARMSKNTSITGKIPYIQKALSNGWIKRTDPKKLLAYNSKIMKDSIDIGFKGVKTNGKDDPFLILRLIDNYKLSDAEKRRINPKDPEKAVISDFNLLVEKKEEKKKVVKKK